LRVAGRVVSWSWTFLPNGWKAIIKRNPQSPKYNLASAGTIDLTRASPHQKTELADLEPALCAWNHAATDFMAENFR